MGEGEREMIWKEAASNHRRDDTRVQPPGLIDGLSRLLRVVEVAHHDVPPAVAHLPGTHKDDKGKEIRGGIAFSFSPLFQSDIVTRLVSFSPVVVCLFPPPVLGSPLPRLPCPGRARAPA